MISVTAGEGRGLPESASLLDVLDRVIDKGVVIDAYFRVALAGVDVISVDANVIVASLETYFAYSDPTALTAIPPTDRPTSLLPRLAAGAIDD